MSGSEQVILRPATREDLDAFSNMTGKPTIKAIVAEINGKIIAVGGLAYGKGRWYSFCDLTPEARKYKMRIARTARRIFDEARRSGIKYIYAEADTREPRAVAWLTSLGFELDPRSQHLYRWKA